MLWCSTVRVTSLRRGKAPVGTNQIIDVRLSLHPHLSVSPFVWLDIPLSVASAFPRGLSPIPIDGRFRLCRLRSLGRLVLFLALGNGAWWASRLPKMSLTWWGNEAHGYACVREQKIAIKCSRCHWGLHTHSVVASPRD